METQTISPAEPQLWGDTINLRHYWHVILERRWLVITAFVSVFVLCLIYLAKAPRIYQATARLQINRETDNALNIRDAFSIDGREQDYLHTQYKNLQSRSLIDKVIEALALGKDERYAQRLDKARAVMDDFQIVPIRLSRLVDIKAEHPNAQTAAKMANTLARIFIERNLDEKMGRLTNALAFLKQEADTLKQDVTDAEKALNEYRVKHEMISLEESQNVVLQGLKQAQADVDLTRSKAVQARSVADQVQKALEQEGAGVETIPQVTESLLIQNLKKDLSLLESELAKMLSKYGTNHPSVIETTEAIQKQRQQVALESYKVVAAIAQKAEAAEEELKGIEGVLEGHLLKVAELNKLAVDYGVLNREAEESKKLYDLVLAGWKETGIMAKDKTQNMTIVDNAPEPFKPVKPRVMLTLFLSVVGGLAVALGLAFFVNYLDDSIKSQDDVETYLRLSFLGYVPNIKSNSVIERDLQSHVHPQSTAAEGFRTIRATISLSPKAEKYQLLAVTSTIPAEGKSLVGSNLAIVTAQTGLKTLLIDTDLRRPSVHKAYQLQSPVGLSSYLTEKVNRVDEFIHATEVPNLDVVCCGAVPSSPSELVGSKRMMQFLQEIRGRYDRVILDCPPVSAVSDPLVIASMCDGVLFVTKFNKIRREHARKSIQRIQDAGIHILGVILNDIDFEGKDSYYYSYYYYQNRYYASHYKSDKHKPAVSGPKKP